VNLAICLAQRGLKVVLVDADLGTANVDILLNIQSTWDLSHVIRRERTVEEITIEIEPGLRLVCGASGLPGAVDLDPHERTMIVNELAWLERQCNIMLLDCGAGISSNVLSFAQAANELLVVTTPEPTALTDAYALIKALVRSGGTPPIGLVVNQTASMREGRVIQERVAATARKFLGLELSAAGQILRDENVARAVRRRTAVVRQYPESPASMCLAALAERMAGGGRAGSDQSGFFHRVLSFFY